MLVFTVDSQVSRLHIIKRAKEKSEEYLHFHCVGPTNFSLQHVDIKPTLRKQTHINTSARNIDTHVNERSCKCSQGYRSATKACNHKHTYTHTHKHFYIHTHTSVKCVCVCVCAPCSAALYLVQAGCLHLSFFWSKHKHILTSRHRAQDGECTKTCLHPSFTFRPFTRWHTDAVQVHFLITSCLD